MIFTEQHDEFRRSLRRFIAAEILPHVDDWEEAGAFPGHDILKKMGNAGFLGVTKPEKYGGMGLDYSYSTAMVEELGHIPAQGIMTAIGVQTDMCTPALTKYGSDALCREFLVPTIAGDLIGCIGVSEEQAGSDVAGLKTRAVKDGDDYIITGSKMWITNGGQGDWICLLCNTGDEGAPHHNKTMIIVPLKAKGVTVARILNKLGLKSSDTAQIFFDEVRVPQSNRVGEEGRGFIYQMEQFQEERLFVSTRTVSQLDDCIQMTIDYTRERKTFGKPILDNQVVHFKLAELQTEIEALRSLIYRAVEAYINGDDVTKLASMAKYKAGVLTQTVPSACLQYFGGQGFMWETLISRYFRDTRLTSIGGGANEIMLMVISRLMGIHPK